MSVVTGETNVAGFCGILNAAPEDVSLVVHVLGVGSSAWGVSKERIDERGRD